MRRSGGEVRVLHGVEPVDGGEQGRVGQVQAVGVGHMTQRLHVSVQVLETWATQYNIYVTDFTPNVSCDFYLNSFCIQPDPLLNDPFNTDMFISIQSF